MSQCDIFLNEFGEKIGIGRIQGDDRMQIYYQIYFSLITQKLYICLTIKSFNVT